MDTNQRYELSLHIHVQLFDIFRQHCLIGGHSCISCLRQILRFEWYVFQYDGTIFSEFWCIYGFLVSIPCSILPLEASFLTVLCLDRLKFVTLLFMICLFSRHDLYHQSSFTMLWSGSVSPWNVFPPVYGLLTIKLYSEYDFTTKDFSYNITISQLNVNDIAS